MKEEKHISEFGQPIVVRYKNGHLIKCYLKEFYPTQDTFHITSDDGITHIIKTKELKAVFFVKSFEGDKYHIETNKFDEESNIAGRKVAIKFKDGELITGSSFSYDTKNVGFFLTPADPISNNERIFIISDAVEKIVFLSPGSQ
jgi:hypothetical protein